MRSVWMLFVSVVVLAQGPAPKSVISQPKPASNATPAKPAAAQPAAEVEPQGADAIMAMVKAGISESLVLKMIQRDGKSYPLTTADVLKLQKAGASEKIIEALMDPSVMARPAAVPPQPRVPGQAATLAPTAPVGPAPAPPVASSPQSSADASLQPAVADAKGEEPKKGRMTFLKDRLKVAGKSTWSNSMDSAVKTADNAISKGETTAQTTVDKSTTSVNSAVNSHVDGAQNKVDQTVSNLAGPMAGSTGTAANASATAATPVSTPLNPVTASATTTTAKPAAHTGNASSAKPTARTAATATAQVKKPAQTATPTAK